ncbi:FG-GAP repeat protein [Gimesia aquarii]|uniref:FG-GAP repeat protein n=2 Tax=Gimesia aquarii TaxID=2527964 RepID=A0A517VTR9_9PLAN|nr:FG-GAP repeat protein [Gimesia aquarii]
MQSKVLNRIGKFIRNAFFIGINSRGASIQFSVIILVLLCVLSGCTSKTPMSQPTDGKRAGTRRSEPATIDFVDVTDSLGVDFKYQNDEQAKHYTILESIGGGVAIWDFDLNGHEDLFFPGGGTFLKGKKIVGSPSVLFSQMSAGRFENASLNSKIAPSRFYSHGCTVADFDNDGFPDIVVTGYGGILCWHNSGDGTFEEISQQSGLIDPSWSTSAGWGDLNGDGYLDLYLAHYVDWTFENHPLCADSSGRKDVCPPRRFTGLDDRVFFSNADGTFRDATQEAGLVSNGKGLGVVLGDVDNDSDLDVYVANDTTNNFLYLNDGEGKFQEAALVRGVAVDDEATANGSMGVDLGDFNQDGLPDIWVANYESEAFALYKNIGNGQFLYASRETGVSAIGDIFVGFGTQFGDFDSDGDEDLVVANGHVIHFPKHTTVRQQPLILENRSSQFSRLKFEEANYLSQLHYGRGVAIGDLDNDGDLDLVFANCNERSAILENQSKARSQWVKIRLIGTESNRDAIGARLVFHTDQGDISRFIKGGGSYLSQSSYVVHCGFPKEARVNGVTIFWPSGRTQTHSPIQQNHSFTLIE